MFNVNHSLKTINKILENKKNKKDVLGFKIEKEGDEFQLMERIEEEACGEGFFWRTCGIYYKKKDLIERVNNLLRI